MALRDRLTELYASTEPGPAQLEEREQFESAARIEISNLTLRTRDAAGLAETLKLNDACLALSGTYGADAPRYVERLAALDGDLPAFITRLRDAEGAPDPTTALLGP